MTTTIPFYANYETEKTTTFEFVLGTKHGIQSIKVIFTRDKRPPKVFSGFEPASWEWDTTIDAPPPDHVNFWHHRYVVAVQSAERKLRGRYFMADPASSPVDYFRKWENTKVGKALVEAWKRDGKFLAHWQMLNGEREPVSSAPKRSQKVAEKRQVMKSHNERMMASDDTWGIF